MARSGRLYKLNHLDILLKHLLTRSPVLRNYSADVRVYPAVSPLVTSRAYIKTK